ncbi:MAG: hypothetical protein JST89_14285 [Cyanobacteria bacterium SZAS-4]|nr:hypothetical protein [Cyanobacteria bacterium SZAS-4]
MSISPTNIKTRIELETRVLAAALKQSFERGDSDGVGLAHRQLYLLLKDQKPGNGSSSAVAETGPTGSNGDTSNYLESVQQTDEQPTYADFARSEGTEYSESFQKSAQTSDYQEQLEESDADQDESDTDEAEADEADDAGQELEDDAADEAAESENDQYQAPAQIQHVEDEEVPQIRHESEDYATQAIASQAELLPVQHDPDQAHAIAQYLKYKQTRDLTPAEDEIESDKVEPLPGWHEVEAETSESDYADEVHAQVDESQPAEVIEVQVSVPKPLTEEEEYIRMRKAPPVAKESLPFDQPSAEYAEIFGTSVIEPPQVEIPAPVIEIVTPQPIPPSARVVPQPEPVVFQPNVVTHYPDVQPGPFDALPEPPSYGQFISSTPPSAHEAQIEILPGASEFVKQQSETDEAAQIQDRADTFDSGETMVSPEQDAVELDDSQEGWETLEPTELSDAELHAPKPKRGFIEERIQEDEELEPSTFAGVSGPDAETESASAEALEAAAHAEAAAAAQAATRAEEIAGVEAAARADELIAAEAAARAEEVAAAEAAARAEEQAAAEAASRVDPATSPSSTSDQVPAPPKFDGFYAPQNLGVRSLASGFAPPPESSDLPPELRKAPTTEFPKVLQNATQDLPKVGQNLNQEQPTAEQNPGQDTPFVEQSPAQDLPMVAQNLTQDLPMVGQNSTQDLPQIMNDIRSQQAADYAARKASQSSPRNMPAIDFSLQSESSKPDIDFSLQSETQTPNIDFTTQPKSNKPDIDFSLQSESSKPDIDFSLQSESKAPDTLNAPTGGGFIEAEFVSSDSDSTDEDQTSQDVTSELPVLNPGASLYLEPDETDESQTQKLAAQQMAAKRAAAEVQQAATAAQEAAAAAQQAAAAAQQAAIAAQQVSAAAAAQVPEPPKGPAPYTGVPMMVIPNHAAPTTVPTPLGAAEAAETTGQEEPLPAAPKPPDLYAMLGVSQMSPFEEIHKNFLRRIRKILLKLRGAVRPERDELLKELRRNWVARDILCDPVTRTDYDFRDMGLRGSPDAAVPHVEDGPQRIGQRTPLRIGELLQCAGLLEQAELEIACDMHKAMPEVQFGTFLVRQGFIQERDLDSVLLGQSLLRDGKITVAQFQVAMELSQSRGANISDTLIEHGYITAAELAKLTEKTAESTEPQAADTPIIKEVAVKPRQIEPAAPSNLNASSAVPTWKDQLDWSKPLPVDDDASLMDRNPEKQSLADLLGNVNTDAAEPEKVKISNNAAPSWKDQLDWEQPPDAANDATISSGEKSKATEPQATSEEPSAPISTANAVPSWKDQLDWEQPKDETQTQSQDSDSATGVSGESEEDEYYDDEPMVHSSKETQPISIHPPTSVAPNVTLGKGNLGTTSSTDTTPTAEDQYLQEVLQTTDIFEQPSETGAAQAAHEDDHSDDQHDEHDEHEAHEDGGDEHPSAEGEGFLKKTLGKLKKGDPKDKKKKRK